MTADGPSARRAAGQDTATSDALEGMASLKVGESPSLSSSGSVTITMPMESRSTWSTRTRCVPRGTLSSRKIPRRLVSVTRSVPSTLTVASASDEPCTLS